MESLFRSAVVAALRELGFERVFDPRHVEAYMREEYGSLDGLSPSEFRASVRGACDLISKDGAGFAEFVAQRKGL